mgnify:CR=1 FL=1
MNDIKPRPKMIDDHTESEIAYSMRLPFNAGYGYSAMMYFDSNRNLIGYGQSNDSYNNEGILGFNDDISTLRFKKAPNSRLIKN